MTDVRDSKGGTQGSIERRAGFHSVTGGRLSHHSLWKKKKSENGTLKWGQLQLPGPGLHMTHGIKSTAAGRGVSHSCSNGRVFQWDAFFQQVECLLPASGTKRLENKVTAKNTARLHREASLASVWPRVGYIHYRWTLHPLLPWRSP